MGTAFHGSLSWAERRDGSNYSITYLAPPYNPQSSLVPTQYINDDNWLQPAIIPPTVFKQEINDGSRIGNALTQAILQQWRASITVLENADRIIFVGYSFPVSDFHAKRIFQIGSMLRRRKGHKRVLQILDCVGIEDKNKNDDRKNLLKRIFGDDTNI